MRKIDLAKEREALDRQITFFHFNKAKRKINKCLKAAKRLKGNFFFYYFLAQKLILRGEFIQAIKCFNKALRIRENDGCAYNDKAICLAELGKYTEALNYFNEGIKRDSNCASLYHNKGWLLNLLGRYQQAIICFNKALELQEERPESLYSLADSYFHLKDKPKAKKYFQKTLTCVKGKSSYIYRETLKRLKGLKKSG